MQLAGAGLIQRGVTERDFLCAAAAVDGTLFVFPRETESAQGRAGSATALMTKPRCRFVRAGCHSIRRRDAR